MKSLALILSLALLSGCAAIPDSVNYTAPFDQNMHSQGQGFGVSWNVPKPTK